MEEKVSTEKYGSDIIVDMLKAYDVEYVALNPGSTFRALHESLVDYGGNTKPEIIECCHEEVAVGIAHGYARVKRRPMGAIVHDFVGLLHSTIAIFYAFADYAPVLVMGATGPTDASRRRAGIDWLHTALVNGTVVRDYVKWDDQPASIKAIPESMIRAYRVAMQEPQGPVYVCFDAGIQEDRLDGNLSLPGVKRYPLPTRITPDSDALRAVADMLLGAENPVILADMVGRNPEAVSELIKLADLTATPVIDLGGRFNFPNTHPLDLTSTDILKEADIILALDVPDLERALSQSEQMTRRPVRQVREDCKVAMIGVTELITRSLVQNYSRIEPSDVYVTADTSLALPQLRKLCEGEISGELQRRIKQRYERLSNLHAESRAIWRQEAMSKRDNRPIHSSRLATEIWDIIKDEDWVITSAHRHIGTWARKLWDWNRPDCLAGRDLGTATNIGLSLGVALAYKNTGKLVVDLQPEGDLLFDASALWTAAHHQIPMLVVMFNNKGYWNDWDHQLRLSKARARPLDKAHVGVEIDNPPPNFAKLAESMGCHGFGPIEDPSEISGALSSALKTVKEKKTLALVDVICDAH